ncbi:hypothetical protein ACFQY4_39245 [Catellatospora bangladeshensis]|uniref:Uncharacterized protein n=1 Tax=Catellatospora bangladeshensis TaxID=310355 RepID=A0A8J3JM42_9ACTN|nr:hypothetical protein [Catellatospora bangladeshensis]GIF79599.1 hypothetical protein Cba03nite_09480 [Catellatospora bangladeshensis]
MTAEPVPPPTAEGAPTAEFLRVLTLYRQLEEASPELRERLDQVLGLPDNVRMLGRSRKVSVSMPEDLTDAVQRRVGRGEFSRYVTEAVAKQLELDLLAELAALLEAEHGAVSEQALAEAGAVWPDA